MFGTLLNLCGDDLNVQKYHYENVCVVEYRVATLKFLKKRVNGWKIARLMFEVGMARIDEGVSLKQLIPLFIKKIQNCYLCFGF